jgi:hypothetical protein
MCNQFNTKSVKRIFLITKDCLLRIDSLIFYCNQKTDYFLLYPWERKKRTGIFKENNMETGIMNIEDYQVEIQQKEVIAFDTLEMIADAHAFETWGENIGRGEPIELSDARAYTHMSFRIYSIQKNFHLMRLCLIKFALSATEIKSSQITKHQPLTTLN